MPKKYNITNLERKVLWKKYIGAGLSSDKANERLEIVKTHLSMMVDDMRLRKKTEDEIQTKFIKEWEKICQKAEAME